jgi:hypothetical protein
MLRMIEESGDLWYITGLVRQLKPDNELHELHVILLHPILLAPLSAAEDF